MKLLKLVTFLICLTFYTHIYSKILIFTYAFNRPDFIEIHYKTFKKFLLDDYEFIVFNDAIDRSISDEIEKICAKYNICCIQIPQEIHVGAYNASVRNCEVVNYSLETVGFLHDDIVALFDSDLFLIKEFSIRDYMKGYDIAGLHQSREHVNYLWIGLAFLDMKTLDNKQTLRFDCGIVDNIITDSGGFTYYYLKNNPTMKIKYFDGVLYLKDFFCDECIRNNYYFCLHKKNVMRDYFFSDPLVELAIHSRDSIMELYLYNTFIHYRAGSNWNYESNEYHAKKTLLLNSFFQKILHN